MTKNSHLDSNAIEQRIKLLQRFLGLLNSWLGHHSTITQDRDGLRSAINADLRAAGNAVILAGVRKSLSIAPPPFIGGPVYQNVDPFTNIFEVIHDHALMDVAKDGVEQAIGVYQHMLSNPELMLTRSNDALDLESALKRALRPSFSAGPPNREKEVQDAVEVILITLGATYTRDTEVAPVGGKSFKPDFILEQMDLALEVKLSKQGHGAAAIQEELAADVAAYATIDPVLM